MENKTLIEQYLKAHGCTNIQYDGAWVTFVCSDGKPNYASFSDMVHEAKYHLS